MKLDGIKKSISWFSLIEESIWGGKVESNRYFATISIMFSAVIGAFIGGSGFLEDNFDLSFSFGGNTLPAVLLFGAVISILNIAESVLACKSVGAVFARSGLLLAMVPAAYALGYALSIVVIIIVSLVLAVLVLSFVLKLFVNEAFNMGGPKQARDDFGNTRDMYLVHDNIYRDNSGNLYEKRGNTFHRLQ